MVWCRMVTDAPTGSVSGADDWEWNKWQGDVQTRHAEAPSRDPPDTRRNQPRDTPNSRALAIDLHEANQRLEEELDRKDHRIHYITAHYEGLLEERTRKLDERTSATDRACLADRIVALFGRLTPQ